MTGVASVCGGCVWRVWRFVAGARSRHGCVGAEWRGGHVSMVRGIAEENNDGGEDGVLAGLLAFLRAGERHEPERGTGNECQAGRHSVWSRGWIGHERHISRHPCRWDRRQNLLDCREVE